jgi:hypothetical protein
VFPRRLLWLSLLSFETFVGVALRVRRGCRG